MIKSVFAFSINKKKTSSGNRKSGGDAKQIYILYDLTVEFLIKIPTNKRLDFTTEVPCYWFHFASTTLSTESITSEEI